MANQKLATLLAQWSTFTADREAERYRLQNPPGVAEQKAELVVLNQELAKLKARIYYLKAQIAMTTTEEPYFKATFDATWAAKKLELKDALETALMAEMSSGKSIPAIMNDYNIYNPVWLYKVKDRLAAHQQNEADKLNDVQWCWSNFTGTHKYALGKGETDQWEYVKMMGTIDTDLEGQYAVWDYKSGELLAGSLEVFNSDSESGRQKRKDTLDSVLSETYSGAWKESVNPYYVKEEVEVQ